MVKKLTEKQQKFLDVLFEEAKGDVNKAKIMAGYSAHTPSHSVLKPLYEEVEELTRKFLSRTSAQAAYGLYEILTNPTALGNKEKLSAAKEILDRTGIIKAETLKVESESPIFILPSKEK